MYISIPGEFFGAIEFKKPTYAIVKVDLSAIVFAHVDTSRNPNWH